MITCPNCGGDMECESPHGGLWTCDTCEHTEMR